MLMSLDTRLTTQDPSIKGGIVVVSAVLPSVFPSVASVIISVGSTAYFINYGLMSPIQPQEVNLYQQKKKNILGHGSSLQSVSPTRSTGASWQDARGLISLQVLSWRSLQLSVHSSVSSQGPSSNGSEQTSNMISIFTLSFSVPVQFS